MKPNKNANKKTSATTTTTTTRKKKKKEEKKRKKRKENRACQHNGAETRKGEANDISWTIVLWAATVAAIISRLTLLFPWRRYGFRIEGHIEVHRLPREGGGTAGR